MFSNCGRKLGVLLELSWGFQGSSQVTSGESGLLSRCSGELMVLLEFWRETPCTSRVTGGHSELLSSCSRAGPL